MKLEWDGICTEKSFSLFLLRTSFGFTKHSSITYFVYILLNVYILFPVLSNKTLSSEYWKEKSQLTIFKTPVY